MKRAALAVAVLAVAWPAHAGETSRPVTIADKQFQPQRLVALAGDTVTWTNEDGVTHTVTADDDAFDSGVDPGASFSFTFAKPGRYPYICTIHRFMHGEVDVYTIALDGPGHPIQYGRTATLRGLAPAGVTTVTVQAGSPRGGLHPLTTVTPTADGRFSLVVAPRASTRYRAVAGALASPAATVAVSPRLSVAVTQGTDGTRVWVAASPGQPGAPVALQVYVRELFSWVTVQSHCLSARSRTSFRLTPHRALHVRVALLRGVGRFAPGTSKVVVVGRR